MTSRCVRLVAAVIVVPSISLGEAVITYESYDDLTPDAPTIDLCINCSATIEVWLTPTGGVATTLASAGFEYEGVADNGVVVNGGIVLSDHHWSEPFQDPNHWFGIASLPNPQILNFFGSEPVPVEGLLLGTMTVHAIEGGVWSETTNPINVADVDFVPIPLASGSDAFVVNVGGDAVITYESYDDLTPDDPSIDLCIDCSATIEVWLTPTDGVETTLGLAGFGYEGEADNGVVTHGGIVLSDHRWGDPFQNVNIWFGNNTLPDPVTIAACCGEPVPLEGLLLSTMTVRGTDVGAWSERTNPVNFASPNLAPIPLASGSDLFVVAVGGDACTAILPENDCNDNGFLDICDIGDGSSDDCNGNERPDECELADGTGADCNANAILDECDLASGTSSDHNMDGVLDECAPAFAFQAFLECVSGPAGGAATGCAYFDADRDGDVDWADAGLFQIAEGGCAVTILQNPSDQEVCDGDSVVFEVRAGGVLLSYQWRQNGGDIAGATEPTFVIDEADPGDAGFYDCLVISVCGGEATSGAAEFIVFAAPVAITSQPQGATLCVGDSHFMFVNATGFPHFRWFKDGKAIGGATAPFFSIVNASAQDAGAYHVLASNSCNDDTSEIAIVEVMDCKAR